VARVSGELAESFFTVLFPSDCRLCGFPLVHISRLPVCPECIAAMLRLEGGVCSICGERLISNLECSSPDVGAKCGLCRRIEPFFTRAVAYGSFEGGLRELIHLLKYSGVRPAANELGRMLAEAIAELQPASEGPIAMIPVPVYRGKLRQGQFNHAEIIARFAGKFRGKLASFRLCPELLEKTRDAPSQSGLTSHQRRQNVRGAFRVTRREAVKGREVLVVDDVYTTGATVSECARVLRRAGAAKVWVATVARTMKSSEQRVKVELPSQAFEGEEREEKVRLARAAAG
jgi:ComF family protein